MAASPPGTYTQYPELVETLPGLVRQQRRVALQLVPLASLAEQDKILRKQIDALLIAAQIEDRVTCGGYDVIHHPRAGNSSLNEVVLTEQLVAAGVDRGLIQDVLKASTETGEPTSWAEVKASKGAAVRTPKAGLSPNRRRAS